MLPVVKKANKMILRTILEKELKEFIKKSRINDSTHDLSHTLSVWKNAKLLAPKKVDMEILIAAVFLHDLGRFDKSSMKGPHGFTGAKHAKKILKKINFPKEKIQKVLEAIKYHDAIYPLTKRKTIESKILFDADKLDVFGPYGIARHLTHQALCGFSLKKAVEEGIIANKEQWRGLGTKKARKLVRKKYIYTTDFYNKLKKELK